MGKDGEVMEEEVRMGGRTGHEVKKDPKEGLECREALENGGWITVGKEECGANTTREKQGVGKRGADGVGKLRRGGAGRQVGRQTARKRGKEEENKDGRRWG